MTIEHTATRITYRANGSANSFALLDDTGDWFMSMLVNGRQLEARQEANLRRLAACWNACEGISTEALETGPTIMAAFQREQDRADTAERTLEQAQAYALWNPVVTNFDTLINAARERIAERIEDISGDRSDFYTDDDRESAETERQEIETQAQALEQAQPTGQRHYAVTGRICGDDEDTLLLVTAEEHEQATEAFKAELRAIRNVDPEDQDDTEIFIGAVVWSATPIHE